MSWIEVESKIRIDDEKEIRKKIKEIAHFVKKENKIDDYYAIHVHGYPKKSLRVRHKGSKREVNFKERLFYKNGVWAKKEVEFNVFDLNGFYDFMNDFGFKKWMRKEKFSETYMTKDKVGVELNFVKKLGWFIEIEYLSKSDRQSIDKAMKRVVEIRKELGLKDKDVIKSGYTKQLWKG